MKNHKYKSIIINFINNLLAYGMPVAIIQFLVQPIIANYLGAEANGLFLTIIALNYFLTNISSGVLLQTRMLQNEKYKIRNIIGDYNLILIVLIIITEFIMFFSLLMYLKDELSFQNITLSLIVLFLFIIHDYICVQYRVELSFDKILISNVLLCIGYIVGIFIYIYIYSCWQIIFIVAYGICEMYDLKMTTYIKEPAVRTILFAETLKRYFILLGANSLTYLVSYGDRLFLYPITDGETVSIYVAASLIGKMLMLISTPVSGFMLSYLIREESLNIDKLLKKYHYVILITFLVFLWYMFIVLSKPLLFYLYPLWAEQSLQYVPIVVAVSLIQLITVLLNVIVIRFCDSKWQIFINAEFLIIYMIFSFTLLKYFGLIGFCWGNLIAMLSKLIATIIALKFGYKTTKC